MKNSNRVVILALTILSMLLISVGEAKGQSTIFSMPSTDILNKGLVGVRFAGKFKFNDEPAKKQFTAFTPRVVIGASKDVEVGINFLGNVQPGADATTLVPTVKWRVYKNEKAGVAVVLGNNLHIPVRYKKYNIGTYSYVQASKYFKTTRTRLTFGTYLYSKNVVASNANRGGGQFAVEQYVSKKISFAAEWLTGRHASGYFMPGVKIKLHKRATVNFGYTIHNNKATQGNHYFYASVGVNFGSLK